MIHASDCATHNKPAMAAGPCDCKIEIEHEVDCTGEWTRYFARGHHDHGEFRKAYCRKLVDLGLFDEQEAPREASKTHVRHVFLCEVSYGAVSGGDSNGNTNHVVCDASVPCAFAATVTELT